MTIDLERFFLLLVLLGAIFLFWMKKRPKEPSLFLAESSPLLKRKSIRVFLAKLVPYFFWLALFFLGIALCNPEKILFAGSDPDKKEYPRKGIALYFLLDQSGSMNETVSTFSDDRYVQKRKMDLAKSVVADFMKPGNPQRENDMIGLIAFARAADVISPLTLDRQALLDRLEQIEPVSEDRINGTAIGYAIFKAVHTIVSTKYFSARQEKGSYAIDNQSIILITDGLQSPHPQDRIHPFRYTSIEDALKYAEQSDVRVYFVGVDPIYTKPQYRQEVQSIQDSVEKTGGAFYVMTASSSLDAIFSKIDALEKSPLQPKVLREDQKKESLVFFFSSLALFFIALAILLETLFVRRVP